MSDSQHAGVKPVDISDELRTNFLTYASHVIRERAIPDVCDGLKPVHRRILWAMWEMGCKSGSPHRKSARITGEVIGKFHPHGDTAAYDAMARMAQSFSMTIPLVEGRGNFGSVDGHPPAAARYTEAKLSKFGEMVLFSDINDDTVDFVHNYTGEFEEPVVLPVRLPLILLTAPAGIAVGMATNIPPFNLEEICNGVIAVLKDEKIDVKALRKIIQAPDFPLGGLIHKSNGITEMYDSGRGAVDFRSTADFESEGKKKAIIIKSVPFGSNKSDIIKEIAEAVRDGKIEGVSEVRDESSKLGIRICVELGSGGSHEAVLSSLYNKTRLAQRFSMNSVAIVGNKPRTVGVLEVLRLFVDFRRDVIRRRTKSRKEKDESRYELVIGMLKAIKNSQAVMKIVQSSSQPLTKLRTQFGLSERQAEYVYSMPIRRFSKADVASLNDEEVELKKRIKDYEDILSNPTRVDQIIEQETIEIRDKFASTRKTIVVDDFKTITAKEMTVQQDIAMMFMSDNTVKITPVDEYKLQKRRQKGITGVMVPDGVYPEFVASVNSHDTVFIFTDKGNRYPLNAFDLPVLERGRRPKPIKNYISEFGDDERVVAVTKSNVDENESLVMLSDSGKLKKQDSETVRKSRNNLFYPVKKGGDVVDTIVSKNDSDIVIVSKLGKVLRTSLSEVREITSRMAVGIASITLNNGDVPIALNEIDPNGYLLTVTRHGTVKRTSVSEFNAVNRRGKGVRGCMLKDDDELVFACIVHAADEESSLLIMTNNNKMLRIPVSSVAIRKKDRLGVMSKKFDKGEFIKAASLE